MPYSSASQMRKFFAMERRGELPKGTAREWAHHTPSISALPERKKKRKKKRTKRAFPLTPEEIGRILAEEVDDEPEG